LDYGKYPEGGRENAKRGFPGVEEVAQEINPF
jgi:hypothetical protein